MLSLQKRKGIRDLETECNKTNFFRPKVTNLIPNFPLHLDIGSVRSARYCKCQAVGLQQLSLPKERLRRIRPLAGCECFNENLACCTLHSTAYILMVLSAALEMGKWLERKSSFCHRWLSSSMK